MDSRFETARPMGARVSRRASFFVLGATRDKPTGPLGEASAKEGEKSKRACGALRMWTRALPVRHMCSASNVESGLMFRSALFAAVLSAFAFAAPAMAACPAGTADDIRAAYSRWLASYGARDLDGTMAIFDKDVVFQFQGAPDAGWNALKKGYQIEFAHPSDDTWTPVFGQIAVSADLGAAFATWTLTKSGKATQQNVSVDLFRRNAVCEWHIVRSLNYPKK
jgi:ketosteroid isomerase-like protein